MGVMGSLFPQPKITEDSDAASDGRRFRLGPIDLESGVVQLNPVQPAEPSPPSGPEPEEGEAGGPASQG